MKDALSGYVCGASEIHIQCVTTLFACALTTFPSHSMHSNLNMHALFTCSCTHICMHSCDVYVGSTAGCQIVMSCTSGLE